MAYSTGEYKLENDDNRIYHTFIPTTLRSDSMIELDEELISLLISAHRLIGTINGMTTFLPESDIIKNLLIKYESILSCRLSGINVSMRKILDTSVNNVGDAHKAISYAKALRAIEDTQNNTILNLTNIRNTYKILIDNEFSDEAGKFRTNQIIVQKVFSNLAPVYNPPNPKDMIQALSDLEKYMYHKCDYDLLIQSALIYYQFVTIQPFEANNDQMGRILLNMFFLKKGLLSHPILCLSYFMLKSESEYYNAINSVRTYIFGKYEPWVKYFLKSIVIASEKTIDILDKLHELRVFDYAGLHSGEKVLPIVERLYKYIWQSPIIEVRHIAPILGASYNTVAKAVNILSSMGILQKIDEQNRYRRFEYSAILNIFDDIQ